VNILSPIEYEDAGPEVRAVYDEIRAVRKTTAINNFWKTLAHDPMLLQLKWKAVRTAMAPGQLDALTKELVYMAVGVSHGNDYALRTHLTAARGKGLTDAMYAEFMAVVQLAAGNVALINGLGIELDAHLMPDTPTKSEARQARGENV
jgi:alkylhydroperoxidase/carboxymuconolactone decarboxylase family protein YurZ